MVLLKGQVLILVPWFSLCTGYTSSVEDLALRPLSSSTFMEEIAAELELALEGHL